MNILARYSDCTTLLSLQLHISASHGVGKLLLVAAAALWCYSIDNHSVQFIQQRNKGQVRDGISAAGVDFNSSEKNILCVGKSDAVEIYGAKLRGVSE